LQNVSFPCERCCVVFSFELLIEAIGRASHTA
jgi:hypothetical protein